MRQIIFQVKICWEEKISRNKLMRQKNFTRKNLTERNLSKRRNKKCTSKLKNSGNIFSKNFCMKKKLKKMGRNRILLPKSSEHEQYPKTC